MDRLQELRTTIKKLEESTTPSLLKDGYEIDTVRNFLEYLGNPQKAFKIIHIGGTSGKGSTAYFTSALLNSHGIKAGLFTSPHISSVRERIKVGDREISNGDFIENVNFVLKKAREFTDVNTVDPAINKRKLTYFEILLAAALVHFKNSGVEVAVIEVGLGGKLDPTNVLHGDVAVLTNIGLDHTEILGDTIEKIAKDKVEIIKKGSIVISGFKQKSTVDILMNKVAEKDVKILLLGKEFDYDLLSKTINGSEFDFIFGSLKIEQVRIYVLGAHQVVNACIALTTFIEYCKLRGNEAYKVGIDINFNIDIDKVKKALSEAKIPGRIEVKSKQPLIIWDSAHNEDKMNALVETISELDELSDHDIYLLFAFKKGQDRYRLLDPLEKLGGRVKKVVLTKYKLKQDVELESEPVQNFLDILREKLPEADIRFDPDPKSAYEGLTNEVKNKNKSKERQKGKDPQSGKGHMFMLLVTGSFYLLSSLG